MEELLLSFFTFFILLLGGLIGSGITLLAVRRRKRLDAAKEKELQSQMAEEISVRVADVLEQVMSRFESLEERLEFSERLMLERRTEQNSGSELP